MIDNHFKASRGGGRELLYVFSSVASTISDRTLRHQSVGRFSFHFMRFFLVCCSFLSLYQHIHLDSTAKRERERKKKRKDVKSSQRKKEGKEKVRKGKMRPEARLTEDSAKTGREIK